MSLHVESLIYPVPYTSSYQTFGTVLYVIPVFIQISHRIPHGMGILTYKERLVPLFLVIPNHSFDGRVKMRFHIHRFVLSGIMDGAAIHPLRGVIAGFEISSCTGLVAQRPENDGRMVPVTPYHTLYAVNKSGFPALVIREQGIGMAFNVRFVHHIDTVIVAQGIHPRIVGVMTGAEGVDVETLEHQYVLPHALQGNGFAEQGMNIMTIHAFEKYGRMIDIYPIIPDFNFPESIFLSCRFKHIPIFVHQFDIDRI